ncbi:MAG: hypothetical protein ACSHX8_06540 [Opitutaceae bacterium]
MRITFVILLSLMFVVQGHAFGCVVETCHDSEEPCVPLDAAQTDCCCSSESTGCHDTDSQTCSTDCEIKAHSRQQVFVLQQGAQLTMPALALLSVLKDETYFSSNSVRHLVASRAPEPPSPNKLSVNYCIWRL